MNPSRRKGPGPVATLLLLAPLIGEVMSGATRVSFLFVLIPEIMVWGCGALLIREMVRRWRGGWFSLFLLGLGLAIAEEFLIQQTSLAPLPWLGDKPIYGRAFGVNWVYFLYMLGFESVWIVLVPVLVTELLFPEVRDEPWLRLPGRIGATVTFLLGSLIAWYAWVKQARPNAFHAPEYNPPALTLALGAAAILLLALAGWHWRAVRSAAAVPDSRSAPAPWQVASVTFALGLLWYVLLALVFIPVVPFPFWIPLLAGLVFGSLVILLLRRWASFADWNDEHRWAVAFGALVACMVGGFAGAEAWPTVDIVGKAIFNLAGVLGMLALHRQIRRRSPR